MGIQYWFGQHGVARGNQPSTTTPCCWCRSMSRWPSSPAFAFLIALGINAFRGTADAAPPTCPTEAYPEASASCAAHEPRAQRYLRGGNARAATDGSGLGLPSAAVMAGLHRRLPGLLGASAP